MEKIRSRRGDTLVEALFALLIAAVALAMMAQVIASSFLVLNRTKQANQEIQKVINTVKSGTQAESSSARSVTVNGCSISLNLGSWGSTYKLYRVTGINE